MKYLLIILLFASVDVWAQVEVLDSLQKEFVETNTEEKKIDILNRRAYLYLKISLEKMEADAEEALHRANSIQYKKGIADAYVNLGICYSIRGTYDKGLDYFIKGLKIREDIGEVTGVAKARSSASLRWNLIR